MRCRSVNQKRLEYRLQVGVELTKREVKFKRLINSQLPMSLCASGERPQLPDVSMQLREAAKLGGVHN
jgi:hypothetical protein